MTDVRLYHADDGGEIDIVGGRFGLDDTPETAVYLSLFGGNELDAGTAATAAKQWWGNLLEGESASRKLRSETQHLLRSLPATPANLRRVEDAAGRDLAWMVTELDATVTVTASMPARNRVGLKVEIAIGDSIYTVRLEEKWGAS